MGSFLSGLFGGSNSTSQTTTKTPNSAVLADYLAMLKQGQTLSSQPYPDYTPSAAAAAQSKYDPSLVAAMTPQQYQAMSGMNNLPGYSQPYMQAAAGLAGLAASPIEMQQFSPGAVNQYLSPYMQDVMGSAVANINETNAQQQQQVLGNTIARGAFGGDRGSIAQSELARQQGLANNATLANIANTGYGQALGEFNNQQQQNMLAQLQSRQLAGNAAGQFANIGTQGQNAYLQGLQAQYGAGTAQQQQEQARLSTAYQQYLNQQQYPYQQLNWYSGLLNGAASGMGGTTTAQIPQPSLANQLIGGIGMIGAMNGNGNNYFNSGLSSLGSAASSIGSGISNAASGVGNWLSGLGFAEGGRVGYADGGSPTVTPDQAYKNYVALTQSGTATPSELDAAYQQYLSVEQNYVAPPTTTPAATPTTPPMTKNQQNIADQVNKFGAGISSLSSGNNYNGGNGGRDITSIDNGNAEPSSGGVNPNTVKNPADAAIGLPGTGDVGSGNASNPSYGTGQTIGGLLGGVAGLIGGGIPGAINGYRLGTGAAGFITGPETLPTPSSTYSYPGAGQPEASQSTGSYVGGNAISQAGDASPNVASVRNNNPGAQWPGTVATQYGSTGYQTLNDAQKNQIATFSNPIDGAAAAFGLMDQKYVGMTVGDAIARWSGNEDTPQKAADYVANVTKAIGVPANTVITSAMMQDPSIAIPLAQSMAKVEAGGNYPMPPGGWEKAYAAFSVGLPYSTYNAIGTNAIGPNEPIMTAPESTGAQQNASSDVSNPYGFANNLNVNGLGGVTVADSNPSGSGLVTDRTMTAPAEAGNSGNGSFGLNGPQSGNYSDNASASTSGATRSLGDLGGNGGGGNGGGSSGGWGSYGMSTNDGGASVGSYGNDSSGSDGGGGEKRGGLVTRHHHYDSGGVVAPSAMPQQISLQYGMPTQADLKRFAQSIMGSGAGQNNAQAEALAASGVVPQQQASGGRIHKQVAGPVVWSGGDMMPDQSFIPTGPDAVLEEPKYQPSVEVKPSGLINRTSGAYDPTMGGAPPQKQDLLEHPASSRTEPVMPKIDLAPAKGPEEDWSVAPIEEEPKKKGVQVAQNVNPKVMSDAEPQGQLGVMRAEDPYRLAAFQAFARLAGTPGSFGVGMAAAADQYAKTLMAGQEAQRKQFETLATAGEKGAQADYLRTQAMMGRISDKGFGSVISTQMPDGSIKQERVIVPPGQAVTAGGQGEVSTSLGGAGTPSATPPQAFSQGPAAGAADPQEALYKQAALTPYIAQDINQAAISPEIQARKYTDFDSEAQKLANASRQNQNTLYNQIKALSAIPDDGFMKAGAGANVRYLAANYFNQVIPGLGATPDNIANAEIANKIANYTAQSTGNDAAAVWKNALAKSQPGIELQKATSNELLASALVNQKREVDRGTFSNWYGGQTYQHGGSGNSVFDKINPPALYQRDQLIFQDMLNNKSKTLPDVNNPSKQVLENPVTAVLNGRMTPAEFDAWADKTYGSRYGIKNLHLSEYLR